MTQDIYAPPPEDQRPAPPPPAAPPTQGSNGLAIAALIVGILAIGSAFIPLFGMIVALPGGVAAIVMGVLARKRVPQVGGGGLAMAGIITGAAGIVIALVWALLAAVVFTQVEADLQRMTDDLERIEAPPPASQDTDAPPPASAEDPDTSQYAPTVDDAEMQRLVDQCAANDMEACNDLYRTTPFGSEAEEFGATCGARNEWMPGACR
jgi:hypothetical protein